MEGMQKPRNRAERRAQAKVDKKNRKRLLEYIRRHPEAFKVDLDEDAIKEAGVKEDDVIVIGGEEVGEVGDSENGDEVEATAEAEE